MFKISETTQTRAQMLATKFIAIALMHFVIYGVIQFDRLKFENTKQ